MQDKNEIQETGFASEILDALPEAITYLVPVYTDGKITDFVISYLNSAAAKYTGKIPILMIGKHILAHQLPSASSYKQVFEQSVEAYHAETPLTTSYYNAYIASEVTITRKRFKDGVLSFARSLTPVKAS